MLKWSLLCAGGTSWSIWNQGVSYHLCSITGGLFSAQSGMFVVELYPIFVQNELCCLPRTKLTQHESSALLLVRSHAEKSCASDSQHLIPAWNMQVQERFDVSVSELPDQIDKELYRHDE